MKKFTHPQKNNTLIKFQNGSSYTKYWVYYRTFINDSSSISYTYLNKLKQFKFIKKENKIMSKEIKKTNTIEQNSFISEIHKRSNFFNKNN